VADAVNHDVAAGVDPAGVGGCELRWRGITDAERFVEGAVWIAGDDAVVAFGDSVVSGCLFWAEASAAEGDAELLDGLAFVKESQRVGVLDDEDCVGGGEWCC